MRRVVTDGYEGSHSSTLCTSVCMFLHVHFVKMADLAEALCLSFKQIPQKLKQVTLKDTNILK